MNVLDRPFEKMGARVRINPVRTNARHTFENGRFVPAGTGGRLTVDVRNGEFVVNLTDEFLPEGEALYDRDNHPGIEGNRRIGIALARRVQPLLAK